MRKQLEPHQERGAAALVGNPHFLLADQPGLGKTLQVIAAVERLGLKKILVICPASVRSNWAREVFECLGHADGWQFKSYNAAGGYAEALAIATAGGFDCGTAWDAIVLDEAHFLKTPESIRTQAIFGLNGLARRATYKWALTGTPVLNRPRELYPLLKTLCPAFADTTYSRYTQRYCGAFFDGRALNTKGATHLDELAGKLHDFMLRRTWREVYPDRKAPIVSRIPVELSPADLAAVIAAEDEIGARESKLSPAAEDYSQLGDTSRLLRLLGMAKVAHVVGFVGDLLQTIDKVVVFAHHRDVVTVIERAFSSVGLLPVVYQGGMSDGAKDAAVSKFIKNPKCRVFIGQRQAAGTGINGLQKVCSTVVIAEPSWVPAETEQMIGRLDRMGQEDELVNAYVLYACNTLDAVVTQVHDRKEKVVERLMTDPLEGLR